MTKSLLSLSQDVDVTVAVSPMLLPSVGECQLMWEGRYRRHIATAHGPSDIAELITLPEFYQVDDTRVKLLAQTVVKEMHFVLELLARRRRVFLTHTPLLLELGGGRGRLSVDSGLFMAAITEGHDPLSVEFCRQPVAEARAKLAKQLSDFGLLGLDPQSILTRGLIQRLEKAVKRAKGFNGEETAGIVVESDVLIHNDLVEVASQVRQVLIREGMAILCEPVQDFNAQYADNPQKNTFTRIWSLNEYDAALEPLQRVRELVHFRYFSETYTIMCYACPNFHEPR